MEALSNLGNFFNPLFFKSGMAAVAIGFFTILVLGFFYRRQLLAIFGAIFGYRERLDDLAMAVHANREKKIANEFIFLIHKAEILLLPLAGVALLFSPYAALAVVVGYVYYRTSSRVKRAESYPLYPENSIDNKLLSFLNANAQKIEFVFSNIYFLSSVLIIFGAIYGNIYIASLGAAMAFLSTVFTFFTIMEASALRRNFRPVEAFRALRLIKTSGLINKSGLFFVMMAGFVTDFTELTGFVPIVWLITLIKLASDMTVNTMLERTNRLSKEHQEIDQRDYNKIENHASYPNPISHSRGYKWTTPLELKLFSLGKQQNIDKPIFLDHYGFFPEMVKRTSLINNPLVRGKMESEVDMTINALTLSLQMLVIGGMGSGKTEFVHNIIQQNHESNFTKYQSIIFNDIKGDYRSRFYREDKDIIVSLFDKRAAVWDMFAEMENNINAGDIFISNVFESISGDGKDFFFGRAKQMLAIWIQESHFESNGDSLLAWELFFDKIDTYENSVGDDRTKSSLSQTISIVMEILEIMKYQIVVEKRKTFSLAEFSKAKDVQVFLANDQRYESKLTPYLTGIWAAYTATMLGLPDNKKDLILVILDELLTMKIQESVRKAMMTLTRSKGCCNIIGVQNIVNSKEIEQDLESSLYAMIIFRVNDDHTIKKITEKLGNQEMLTLSVSPKDPNNGGGGGDGVGAMVGALKTLSPQKNTSPQFSMNSVPTILPQQIQSMPEYHHITFIPGEEVIAMDAQEEREYFKLFTYGYEEDLKEAATDRERVLERNSGILYLGYTPQAILDLKQAHAVDWDMEEYYTSKSKLQELKTKLGNVDERTAFGHYCEIQYAEEGKDMNEYIVQNGLIGIDLDLLFRRFRPNEILAKRARERYTKEERELLVDTYYGLKTADEMYDFLGDNGLFGVIDLLVEEAA